MDKLFKYKIDKGALSKIDKEERSFFFALGHVANEINILNKQTVWSGEFKSDDDWCVKGQITLSLFFHRTLAGKLNEANELIRQSFLSKKFSKDYVALSDSETKEVLEQIKKYFGKSNIVNKIRNSHAFHYSSEDFSGNCEEVPDELELFLHKTQGNSLYYASELMATYAMMKSCGEDDFSKLFGDIVNELISVSKLILSFSHLFMSMFMVKYSENISSPTPEELELGELPKFSQVNIPWFIEMDIYAGAQNA